MVASGRIAYLARRAAEYGVGLSGTGDEDAEVVVDMQKVRQRKRDIVNSFRGGSERRLKGADVDVVMGEASFTGPKEIAVKMSDGSVKALTADTVYINAGCRPSRPDIPGLSSIEPSRVLDSTSIQELGEVPKHLVVIGGGYIGLEFGQLFRRLGSKVTILHRGERLGPKQEDPELAECMQGILREDGVEVVLEVKSTKLSVSDHANLPITVTLVDREHERCLIHASHILLSTGRIPNTDSLNVAAAGLKTDARGFIQASPSLETNVEGVYVLGDIKGGPAFTHISYDDFRIIRDNLTLTSSKTSGTVRTTEQRAAVVPSVVYTDPQFASIGPKLGSLPPGKYVSYSMPGTWIARGLETDETRGMLKAVIDPETDKIVSFSAINAEGGELMAVVQMAMLGGLTWRRLQDGVFAHPSWSEALNNLWGGERKEFTV
jgi:pyruvate/2-oxoglutarate dehydrogenase complex dihydrolipoamide dehydrogenase (E3) component